MLTAHFYFLRANDSGFLANWAALRPSHRLGLWRLLRKIEIVRMSYEKREGLFCAHCDATAKASAALQGVREIGFQRRPDSEAWITAALQQEHATGALQMWNRRLQSFVCRHAELCVRFYGGLKPYSSLRPKITEHFEGNDLDLWDRVRFRIVAPDFESMRRVATSIQEEYRLSIIRCRNYYERPRNGQSDPYRAVHFELEESPYNYVEVQVLTAIREAVGLLDHTLKKGRVKFTCDQHANWLADFSFAGNILDAADLVDLLKTGEAGETLRIQADSVSGSWAAARSPFPVLAMCS